MVADSAPVHHLTRAVCVEPLKDEEAAPSSSSVSGIAPVNTVCPWLLQHPLQNVDVAITGSRLTITARPSGDSPEGAGVIHWAGEQELEHG
eukprot:scaffold37740_cov59-Phaeocystis_antarctica.AAC.4